MTPFKYQRATSPEDAVRRVAANPNARFLGGGTNLLDLMKEDVMRPGELVDINGLGLDIPVETFAALRQAPPSHSALRALRKEAIP